MKNTLIKNKGFIIALFAMIFSIAAVNAQPGQQKQDRQGPPPIPSEKQIQIMVDDLSTELSLTDEQENQVSKIFFAHFEEAKEKMESAERPERKEMEKLKKDFEKEVKAQLTEDQKKQFDVFMKKQKPPQGRQK